MQHIQTQKITACLPIKLLQKAQAYTGKDLTKTLKIALEQLVCAHTYKRSTIDINKLYKEQNEK